jgi:DNA-binding NtrC family response regulator
LGFFFPEWKVPENKQASKISRPSSREGPRKSLIIIYDLDKEFVNSLSRDINLRGIDCVIVNSPKEAMAKALERMPEAVILGRDIGKKENGLQIGKAILSHTARTKIVILTDDPTNISKKDEKIGIELFIDLKIDLGKIVNSICALCELRKPVFDFISK